MKLNATAQSGTLTVDGTPYEITDGVVTVDNPLHIQQLLASHGFTEWKEKPEAGEVRTVNLADVDQSSELDETKSQAEAFLEALPFMPRGMLMRTLKDMGVAYPQTASNDDMRAMIKPEVEKRIVAEKAGNQMPPIKTADEAAATLEAELKAQRDRNAGLTDAEVDAEVARLTALGMTPEQIVEARAAGEHGFKKPE